MNKLRNKIILLVALLLVLPLTIGAIYLFKSVYSRETMNSSTVNCIRKDANGFVWFGTPSGLYRYDGYTYKAFQSNSLDGSSLPDSYVIDIQEALDGTLWIKTSSGYCLYYPQTESFERNMHQVYSRLGINGTPDNVYIDNNKNIWANIPKKGVMAYNMQQQLLYEFSYTNDYKGIPSGTISYMDGSRDGTILLYDDGLIVCCDIMHQQRTLWKDDQLAKAHLRKSKELKVFADQQDNIWVYGPNTLMVYYKKSQKWDFTFGDKIGMTSGNSDHAVTRMAGDKAGNIWIATDNAGLIRLNANTHEVEFVQPQSLNDQTFAQNMQNIQSVFVDDTDLLWVGTERAGVAYYGNGIYKFQVANNGDITAIAEDDQGNLFYGTADNGLLGYEGLIASNKVTALQTTDDGSIWVGSRQRGLTRIKDGQSTIYSFDKDGGKTVIDDHINDLCKDKSGNLWIATNGGLQVYNPKMNTFSTYTKENGKLPTNDITTLFFAKNNKILAGSNAGLIVVDVATTDIDVYDGNASSLKKFTNTYITQVIEDTRGLIWVGTREGLNVLNLEDDNLDYITEKQGLCNNNIAGVTEDKNRNIWVTTSNGVCRIVVQRDHEKGSFNYGLYNYDVSDGLQGKEFNLGAILTKRDGNVIFGGLFGVNWIASHARKDEESLPRVMLTQLFFDDKEVLTGHEYQGSVPLPQALNSTQKLELANDQNTFTIKFAAGNYNQSERLQFMYWMEGLDNDWKNGDAMTHGVTFTDLSWGKYILHVKAVSALGAVSKQERTLEIRILPPWWISWWMIVAYIAIAIVAFFIWKDGFARIARAIAKRRAILDLLAAQKDEIQRASDDLCQPMARMTSLIGDIAERDTTIEGKEQVNQLHFQMLQVVTRLSEMQMALDDPEALAKQHASKHLQLNESGEVNLLKATEDVLTYEITDKKDYSVTKRLTIMLVDSNDKLLHFMAGKVGNVYDIHMYNDVESAMLDLETLKPHLIVCAQVMPKRSGSEFCNIVKSNVRTQNIKFVLMTDGVLSPQEMKSQDITLAADDFLAKPFSISDFILLTNNILGVKTETTSKLIEGEETRRLEGRNSSMTTASDVFAPAVQQKTAEQTESELYSTDKEFMDDNQVSMMDYQDQQLLQNINNYVVQNMSRGQIDLEEMASAMGMSRVPFFHKVRNVTGKTPAELVREIRLKHACTLLEKTNLNMSELAINIGFTTADNFINIFKDRFGMSPLEYRMTHFSK